MAGSLDFIADGFFIRVASIVEDYTLDERKLVGS
jgi:hypothetical protein